MASMPQPDRDPLAATGRLLIDGTNLLHALSRTPGAAPPAALIGRLRGAIPAAVAIELVFDGPPERGLRDERIASGLTVRYSGPRTGDAVIIGLIDDVRLLDGADGTATLLVVTDDRDLRHGSRLRGARTAGSAWLLGRLGRASAVVAVGRESAAGPRRSPGQRGQPDRRGSGRDGPAPAGSRAGARRPSAATRNGPPRARTDSRAAGLIGCRREHRRRAEPDLDPDPAGHGDLRHPRLGSS